MNPFKSFPALQSIELYFGESDLYVVSQEGVLLRVFHYNQEDDTGDFSWDKKDPEFFNSFEGMLSVLNERHRE